MVPPKRWGVSQYVAKGPGVAKQCDENFTHSLPTRRVVVGDADCCAGRRSWNRGEDWMFINVKCLCGMESL
ncbi:hypothetical protein TNCV_1740871 [Trichonephila clavipes]|uniref:Uncharacterized protein n=1 Tax=Trichonephila clavipes TaxID=2585209 RepID=A0A8X6RGK1_TRICX|nr:hypothetical protein TNCV_1740871 [Trichonephila clavipes]